ncbi:MAG: N-acetylmuramoyl-L-alanine amidase [Rhizobiaceae bacterium]|nr:N-acetylmuramoyl-L-alanine amidase [Rhizobiaceae bacterium]
MDVRSVARGWLPIPEIVGRGWHAAAALALALCLAFGAVAASAADADPLLARSFKVAGDATRTRVILRFNNEPEIRWMLLRAPHRLMISFPKARFSYERQDLKARGLVSHVQYGRAGDDESRVVLATKGPFVIDRADLVAEESGDGYRFVLDLSAAGERAFEAALAEQAETTASTVAAQKGQRVGPSVDRPAKPFTIVIDAGHGGIDGGAEGASGTVEKEITLAFARSLADDLRRTNRYAVFLTRNTDEFLRLDDRVRIARQHEADLFISIHADTISQKGIRGATVYTVSDTASDADAQALADRENLSDQLAGIEVQDENHQVADILVDLIRRETHAFSIAFARTLVGELSDTVGLINNPHRFAGFRVLKAPDVPSVLVELGYLSNPKDEAQLRDPAWRDKAVQSIAGAISQFATSRAAGG